MNAFTFQIILWIDITEYDKMKREFIHITDNNKHRLMSDSGFWHGSTNKNSRDKMKKILSMAVLNELTERQRICIVDYYLNGKKEKEIAKELGVNSSTVSRHIMKARDKLSTYCVLLCKLIVSNFKIGKIPQQCFFGTAAVFAKIINSRKTHSDTFGICVKIGLVTIPRRCNAVNILVISFCM